MLTHRIHRRLRIEELEPRIAPATYHIASVSDLQNMKFHLSDNCVLDNNVDASGVSFVPVGTLSAPFLGTFDGQGHRISNLTVDTTHSASPDSAGLFGYANGPNVQIKNLGLWQPTVSGGSFLGAVVGNFFGEMTNVYAEGIKITGSGNIVGGLVGQKTGGSVIAAYATGTVGTASLGISIGGLVGDDWGGTISNSYAVVSLNGNIYVGGLAGSEQGAISNSYAAGAVRGSSNTGGLVGYGNGNVTGGYYDTEATGQTSSAGGVGAHTADMKMQSLYVGWDFTNVWGIHEGQSYPYLRWHPQSVANSYPESTPTFTFRAGTPVVFQDDDGSLVRVSLTGPGTGSLTLANGKATWAQIDTIRLAGTTGRSRLGITSTGGAVPGSSFKTMTITEAPGAGDALGGLSARGIDLASGGRIAADGTIRGIALRDVGAAGRITIVGSLNDLSARNVGGGFLLSVTDDLLRFRAISLGTGAAISAGDGIGKFSVAQGVSMAHIEADGAAGIGRLSVGFLYSSFILSGNNIGAITVGGAVENSTLAASGSIGLLRMGATTDSNFMAGVAEAALKKPYTTLPTDFAMPQAAIGSLVVTGVANSNFSAPHFGAIRLANGPAWNAFAIHVLDSENNIGSFKYYDTANSRNNWSWRPGQPWKGGTPLDVITPSRWTFAFGADFRNGGHGTGVNDTATTAIARQVSSLGVSFFIAGGDLACGDVTWYTPQPPPTLDEEFKSFKADMAAGGLVLAGDTSGSGIPFYPVRGNHELYTEVHHENAAEAWTDNFGQYLPQNGPAGQQGMTYAFTYGNGVFLVLEEIVSGLVLNQTWVDQQLAANAGKQQVFAIGHFPAVKIGEFDNLAKYPAQRDALLTSLYKAGERVFLTGHDHLSARADIPVVDSTGTTIGTMEQIVTPSGAPFMTVPWDGKYDDPRVVPREFVDATMGYQLVKVDGPKVTVEFWGTTDACTRTWDPATQAYNYIYSTDSSGWRWSKVDSYSYSTP